jgi:hypothetical protein
VIPYRKFSDTLKNGNCALAPPNPPKPSKVGVIALATGDPLDGLGALDATSGKSKIKAARESTELITPSPWFECIARPADGEPCFELPCAARRGLVLEWDGVLMHFCGECGRWGAYGYGVNFREGRLGRWYCAAHRPRGSAR